MNINNLFYYYSEELMHTAPGAPNVAIRVDVDKYMYDPDSEGNIFMGCKFHICLPSSFLYI